MLHHAKLIVGIKDREIALEPDEFGVAAEHLGGDGVEGTKPGHALDRIADNAADTLAHFACRLVREGDAQDFGRVGFTREDQMGKSGCQCGRLAGASPRQHENGTIGCEYGFALWRVQAA